MNSPKEQPLVGLVTVGLTESAVTGNADNVSANSPNALNIRKKKKYLSLVISGSIFNILVLSGSLRRTRTLRYIHTSITMGHKNQ